MIVAIEPLDRADHSAQHDSNSAGKIEDSQWLVSERLHGTFTCQLHLTDGLDLDKIQADYDRGVLTIRIPVAEGAKARRIEIGGSETSGAESVAS
jgi:HSP20 family molecular chaperone IbpA